LHLGTSSVRLAGDKFVYRALRRTLCANLSCGDTDRIEEVGLHLLNARTRLDVGSVDEARYVYQGDFEALLRFRSGGLLISSAAEAEGDDVSPVSLKTLARARVVPLAA
jgi:hypothetical protein